MATASNRPVSPEQVEKTKKWVLMKTREILRGARATDNIKRWLSGELGPEHIFRTEVVLNDSTHAFVLDQRNAEVLGKERLV